MMERIEAIKDFLLLCEKERHNSMQKLVDKYNIKEIDENALWEIRNTRRPLVLVRGKPVTVEQMVQLVAGEEPLFGEGPEHPSEREWALDPRTRGGILGNIFYRRCNFWIHPWVFSDGTIGGDLHSNIKYPELTEFLPDYMHLGEKYPFLDMVVSYTTYDERTCCRCGIINDVWKKDGGENCKCKDCAPYLDRIRRCLGIRGDKLIPDFEEMYFGDWDEAHVRSDVGDSVVLTIWIHDGKTEVLFGNKAAVKFNEYNNLYCAPEYAYMFSYTLYYHEDNCVFDKKFIEDCFEYVGKPRSLCDEYIKREFIYLNEKAIVVTKEWVINQYNKFIAGR